MVSRIRRITSARVRVSGGGERWHSGGGGGYGEWQYGDLLFGTKKILGDIPRGHVPGERLVPSCFAIFDLEPLLLSFNFVFVSEIFKSLSFSLDCLCHLAILCLDQHAYTLHHLESLLTISLDRLDILKEDLVYQSLRKSLSLSLSFLDS
nr:hypothetical protein [Tanacetum cinerariifolium]